MRGLKNANLPPYLTFLLGYGVDSIDPDLTIHMDGPEAVEAAKIYQKLEKEYAPPGVTGFNWNECQSNFLLGKAAMWLDGIGFAPPPQGPHQAQVGGQGGLRLVPPGP